VAAVEVATRLERGVGWGCWGARVARRSRMRCGWSLVWARRDEGNGDKESCSEDIVCRRSSGKPGKGGEWCVQRWCGNIGIREAQGGA
jgi:hypothetical protein